MSSTTKTIKTRPPTQMPTMRKMPSPFPARREDGLEAGVWTEAKDPCLPSKQLEELDETLQSQVHAYRGQ